MQPVQIGMNAAVVLLALLLAVPVQLLVSHYFNRSYEGSSGEGGGDGPEDVTKVRAEAVNQLTESMHSFVNEFHSTVSYYSTWSHLKELVMVPFKKRNKMSSLQMKTTVYENGGGVTTVIIEPKSAKKSGTSSQRKPETVRKESPTKRTKDGGMSASSSEAKARDDSRETVDEETSPAREVEDYLLREVYFGQSKTVRHTKPAHVAYSVGQVIRHRQDGYFGVIIGWDKIAKAPESWIKRYYRKRNIEQITQSAHYLVLVDSHFDASGSPYRYLPQEDIEIVTNVQVQCFELSKYFEGFKHGRHIPKPWLRSRYPRD